MEHNPHRHHQEQRLHQAEPMPGHRTCTVSHATPAM